MLTPGKMIMSKRNMRLLLLLLMGQVAFLSSCAFAPGMQMSPQGSEDEKQSSEFEGNTVELQRITPALLQNSPELQKPGVLIADSSLLQPQPETYRLGPYDVVVVTVWEHPELTQPLGAYRNDLATGQLIQEDGSMFYPYIGKVQAAGLTLEELRVTITDRLSTLLQNPQVDVKVLRYRSRRIYVNGEVMKKGMVEIGDIPMTVPEAISQAQGLAPSADASRIELLRNNKTYLIDLMGMYSGDFPADQIILQSGDKLRIPTKSENKVYLLGEVLKPQALDLNHGRLTLAHALAEVGGFAALSADVESIYVIRSTEPGKISVYHLDARNPMALVMSDHFALHARDLVYVDTHGLARWNRLITLLLPTAALINNGVDLGREGYNLQQDIQD